MTVDGVTADAVGVSTLTVTAGEEHALPPTLSTTFALYVVVDDGVTVVVVVVVVVPVANFGLWQFEFENQLTMYGLCPPVGLAVIVMLWPTSIVGELGVIESDGRAWLTLGSIMNAIMSAMNANLAAYPRALSLTFPLVADSAETALFPIISQAILCGALLHPRPPTQGAQRRELWFRFIATII